MADEIENEFMKRGYLLPKGCKDLAEVLKPRPEPPKAELTPVKPQRYAPARLPPITGEMTVPSQMTVTELAAALAQKPFRIIADLMELGVFVTIKHQLDFDTISRVVRKYGFIAKI